jgi:hypothetical protein
MTPAAQIVIEHFPSSTWAKPSSKKYEESMAALAPYNETDLTQAVKSLRRTLARAQCTVEEIVGEVRRLRRRNEIAAKADNEGINEEQVRRDREDMKRILLLATREEIAVGVAYARKIGALTAEPLPAKVEEWSEYARGVVWAAMDMKGVFA